MENLSSQLEQNSAFFVSALDAVIGDLPKRSQEIIQSRYGIDGKGSLTLEEIGKKYSITRERVRQVIREVFRKVKDKKDGQNLTDIREKIEFTLEQHSGIMEEKSLLQKLGGNSEKQQGAVKFFLDCLDDVKEFEVKGEIKRAYTIAGFEEKEWRTLKDQIVKSLKQENRPLSDEEMFKVVAKSANIEIDKKKFFDYLAAAEEVQKNNFNKWGLAEWKEISPKGTREKAYLVLKETGSPLHFKEIAQLIDKHKLNKRKTHPQTVHNELIKDKKFVLVGRGIYALSEWGYKKGTVKDVLEEILKQNGKPMGRDEILKKVMEIRQVKKSTVIINLNNFFTKLDNGKYTMKK